MKNKKALISRRYLIFLLVSVVMGFIIGFSYNLSKNDRQDAVNSTEYERENMYRQQLIDQQERNKVLAEELDELEQSIRQYEQSIASETKHYDEMLTEVDSLRLLLGYLPAKGEGIRVQLEDGEYNPNSTNPNDYIIHESHVLKMVNELKIAGAEAIAINGQRLHASSYIVCNGPVITIDGHQYPAPFIIEAIGNKDTLLSALELTGGVIDQLLNDQIKITTEKKDNLTLQSIDGDV